MTIPVTETNRPIEEVAMEYAILEQDKEHVWDNDLYPLYEQLARRVGEEHAWDILEQARDTLKLVTPNN